jgi:hypothetical protein
MISNMKNLLIILLLAIVMGAVGFMATAEIMRRQQNASAVEAPPTGDVSKDLDNAIRESNRASGDLVKRQNAAFVGGGVGVGVGVLLGIVIAMRLDRKRGRVSP